jgi:hypothetical protein
MQSSFFRLILTDQLDYLIVNFALAGMIMKKLHHSFAMSTRGQRDKAKLEALTTKPLRALRKPEGKILSTN